MKSMLQMLYKLYRANYKYIMSSHLCEPFYFGFEASCSVEQVTFHT